MSKKDYDYVVEMMKKYQPEDDGRQCRISYDAIADGLCIVTRTERWPVDSKVKEQFRREYKAYVESKMQEINNPLAIMMFQGTYSPIVLRNPPRNGMVYIEDNLRQVTKHLPKLPNGQRYAFPALKIIRAENGTEAFILPR